MSRVIVEDIWVEDLFNWFDAHIAESCGDGTGVIVCKNYEEVSKWFLDWYFDKHKRSLLTCKYVTKNENSITFHDSNESYIFTNNDTILYHHDYVFVVKEDCIFAHNSNERKVLSV